MAAEPRLGGAAKPSARAFPELNDHQLVVLHGYALLGNAAMPIVGDPDTVNKTYVEKIQMEAQAAIDKAVEMAIADRQRIGVFGHSTEPSKPTATEPSKP